jgi:glycosyltransferase involved in cell wall biosynthesis
MELPRIQENPLVSVLVANYNYGRFLPELTDSMLEQTYPNWELIICDDGSTDGSSTVLERLQERDLRIKPVFKGNGGQVSAWNAAYEQAAGEIIALLDADDWFRKDKLEMVIKAFADQPGAGLVYHRLQCTDKTGAYVMNPVPDLLPSGWLADDAIRYGGVPFHGTTTMAFRREFAEYVFPLPEELGHAGDAYLGMVAAVTTEIAAIPDALTFYRLHGDNHSGLGNVALLHSQSTDHWVGVSLLAFSWYRQFLLQQFGELFADKVRVEDMRILQRYLPPLYILAGNRSTGVHGFSRKQILDMLPNSRRAVLWRVLFALPSFISRRLLVLWWTDAGWKRFVRPIVGFLGLREGQSP